MPLIRRIPKRGFTNLNRVEYQVGERARSRRVSTERSTPEVLSQAGLVGSGASGR